MHCSNFFVENTIISVSTYFFLSFLKSSSPVTAYLCKYIVGQLILLRLRAREDFFYANAQRWVTKKNTECLESCKMVDVTTFFSRLGTNLTKM